MGLFEHWPYVNFHDMNLDWIIKKIKNIETAEANSQASAEASAESAAASQLSADAALASQEAAHQSELNAAQSEENAADSEANAKDYADHIADPVSGLVTGWLDTHVTPTTPVVDDTLTIQGAAADAKAAGDRINEINNNLGIVSVTGFTDGYYLMGNQIDEAVTLSGYNTNWTYTSTPAYVTNGSIIEVSTRGTGMCALAFSADNDLSNAVAKVIADDNTAIKTYTYIADQDGYIWVSGRINETSAIISEAGKIAYNAEIAYDKSISNETELQGIVLKSPDTTNVMYIHAGQSIVIDVTSNTIPTNLLVGTYAPGDAFIQLPTGASKNIFTSSKDGYLRLQNTGTVIDAMIYTTRFDVEIYNLEHHPSGAVYTVKKDGTGNYQSFVTALQDLQDDETEKTIYVYSGVYDIFEELGGAAYMETVDPSANWREVQPLVPANTSIIGVGNVELRFAPTAEQIGSAQKAFLFSPLNISANCYIENISVYGTNCRYAIHDESSGLSQYADTVHTYKNVRARKDHGAYGYNQVYGSGLGARSRWSFESCEFTSDIPEVWTVHTTTSDALDGSSIIFNNCVFAVDNTESAASVMDFITGGSGHNATQNIVDINNCYVGGSVTLSTSFQNQVTQKFNIRSVGSDIKSGFVVSPNFTSNPFPPKIYN